MRDSIYYFKRIRKKIFCKDVWSVLVINSGLIFSVVFKADSQPVAAYLHKIERVEQ